MLVIGKMEKNTVVVVVVVVVVVAAAKHKIYIFNKKDQ
jgi:hypothetical protein